MICHQLLSTRSWISSTLTLAEPCISWVISIAICFNWSIGTSAHKSFFHRLDHFFRIKCLNGTIAFYDFHIHFPPFLLPLVYRESYGLRNWDAQGRYWQKKKNAFLIADILLLDYFPFIILLIFVSYGVSFISVFAIRKCSISFFFWSK